MHTIYSGTHTDIIWHKHAYILLHPHTLACVPTDEHMSLHSCMHMSPRIFTDACVTDACMWRGTHMHLYRHTYVFMAILGDVCFIM